jgi:prevent-host-death family protein
MLNGERIMLNISRDIHSLSDFKRNTHEFIEQLEQTGEPVVLTINGRAKIVVQDADSYQRMLELLDRAETIEAIREGLDAVKLGNTMSLDQFDKEMRKKIRTPKKK